MRVLRVAVVAALLLVALGCASSSKYLHSESTVKHEGVKIVVFGGEYLQEACVGNDFFTLDAYNDSSKCYYRSVDVSPVISRDFSDDDRAKLMQYLLGVSDSNCNSFLDRSFANKSGLSFSHGLFQDLATGASGITAFSSPVWSAGLSGANLLVGSVSDNFDSSYYAGQTFQAVETSIKSARSALKADIVNKMKAKTDKRYSHEAAMEAAAAAAGVAAEAFVNSTAAADAYAAEVAKLMGTREGFKSSKQADIDKANNDLDSAIAALLKAKMAKDDADKTLKDANAASDKARDAARTAKTDFDRAGVYSIQSFVGDLDGYDKACSIRSGIANLVATTEDSNKTSSASLKSAEAR